MSDESNNSPMNISTDMKAILEHVRGQFQYHAAQRLNTIRYFFVAYAIFVAAYVATIDGKIKVPPIISLVLSVTALLIALGFWGLDARNVQMVHVDEDALEEIESLVSKKFGFQRFETRKGWERARFGWILRYGVIVNVLFAAIVLISAAAVVRDLSALLKPS